jgi:hypothetical protein
MTSMPDETDAREVGPVRKTSRGFDRLDFADCYGVMCSLQKSSLADADAIWLGCNEGSPQYLVPGEGWQPVSMPKDTVINTRMHLTREQVAELLPYLQRFVDTGELA